MAANSDSIFGRERFAMPRMMKGLIAVAAACVLLAPAVMAAPEQAEMTPKKRHVTRHWHGYGFLPGYRPPEVIERERAAEYYRTHGPQYYGPAWPGFYRGRWNGGGFGPCYTQTPIGPMWNCGR
jgi:hypothetical protein